MESTASLNATQHGNSTISSDAADHEEYVNREKILAIVIVTIVGVFLAAAWCYNKNRNRTNTEVQQDQMLEEGLEMHNHNPLPACFVNHYPGTRVSLLHMHGLTRHERERLDTGTCQSALDHRLSLAVPGATKPQGVWKGALPPGIPISSLSEEAIDEEELEAMDPGAAKAYRKRRKIIETVGL